MNNDLSKKMLVEAVFIFFSIKWLMNFKKKQKKQQKKNKQKKQQQRTE